MSDQQLCVWDVTLDADAMSARGPGGTDGTSTGNKWFVSGEPMIAHIN
eukprot:COSAG02_NODE_71467_length_191_cov_17.641304_1_plen_47_part_10